MASLLIISFLIIAGYQLSASIQTRKGPNAPRFCGVLQVFADGLKLFLKKFRFYSTSKGPFACFYVNFPIVGEVTENQIC
jgi:NADH:ubiquinone oxidoreductase subunit H